MGSVSPSQSVSTLTTADSLGLAAAGARTALDRGSSATRCVTGVAASLPGAAGKRFLISAGQHIRTLPAARPGAPTHHVVFVGFRDGDTSAVRFTMHGSVGARMWSNDIDHYFVRDTTAGGWRFVGSGLAGASDYVLDSASRVTPVCLNGGHPDR